MHLTTSAKVPVAATQAATAKRSDASADVSDE